MDYIWDWQKLMQCRENNMFVRYSPSSPGKDNFENPFYNVIEESIDFPEWIKNLTMEDKELLNHSVKGVALLENEIEVCIRRTTVYLNSEGNQFYYYSFSISKIIE